MATAHCICEVYNENSKQKELKNMSFRMERGEFESCRQDGCRGATVKVIGALEENSLMLGTGTTGKAP